MLRKGVEFSPQRTKTKVLALIAIEFYQELRQILRRNILLAGHSFNAHLPSFEVSPKVPKGVKITGNLMDARETCHMFTITLNG